MSQFTALSDMLTTLVQRGARLIDRREADDGSLETLCEELLSRKGEATGVALAARIVERIEALDDRGLLAFFRSLAERFDLDAEEVRAAAEDYALNPTSELLAELVSAAEPPRQELLRRLNLAPGGTGALVRLRARLLPLLKDEPVLKRIDSDFRHLFMSWFNRGFLVLRPIDWSTPADILEKIIEYEAVHAIDSWDELRRRLQPEDRRCFAFFHPAIPNEPLIFVEVALTEAIPDSIQLVLAGDRATQDAATATTAVFYSISNCQRGLAGVSFGNFLIKQVAEDLAGDLPELRTFVTLSPVPGLMKWIGRQAEAGMPEAMRISGSLSEMTWPQQEDKAAAIRPDLTTLAAIYLLEAKRPDGLPLDPVARFHLGNGASLHRINWLGNTSEAGLESSGGIMVNYLYDLDAVEANHEAFAERQEIATAKQVRALLPGRRALVEGTAG